jgi:hypothetical protein
MNNKKKTQITNLEECRPCPVFANCTLTFALQLRKKHGKTSPSPYDLMASLFIVNNRYQISWNSFERCQVLDMEMLIVLVLQLKCNGAAHSRVSSSGRPLVITLLPVLTHMYGSEHNKCFL